MSGHCEQWRSRALKGLTFVQGKMRGIGTHERARGRKEEGRRPSHFSRAQNPLFLLFQRADKNRICFSVAVAYSSVYTRKMCHLFFLSPTLFI